MSRYSSRLALVASAPINFEDNIFTVLEVPPAKVPVPVTLHVFSKRWANEFTAEREDIEQFRERLEHRWGKGLAKLYLGLSLRHHEALSDAEACAGIVIAARRSGAEM
jgi:hypothetical protein